MPSGPLKRSARIETFRRPLVGIKLAPHQLRHACATHLVEAGMELDQVQQLLGHRRIDSTERYAQIHGRELQREFLRSHPRARRDSPK